MSLPELDYYRVINKIALSQMHFSLCELSSLTPSAKVELRKLKEGRAYQIHINAKWWSRCAKRNMELGNQEVKHDEPVCIADTDIA